MTTYGKMRLVLLSVLLFGEAQGFQGPFGARSADVSRAAAVRPAVCKANNKLMLGKNFGTRQGGVWALQMNSGSPTSVASNPVTEGDAGKTNKGPPPAKNTQKKKMTVVRKVDAIRNRGMSAGEVDAGKLDKAFTAFADTLLQKKGRVRFYRINEGFRREFPQWASEEMLSNQTLGRRVQIWYENKFNEPLGKSGRGAYKGLTMLSPV